jgi:hypothetical protein
LDFDGDGQQEENGDDCAGDLEGVRICRAEPGDGFAALARCIS